MEGTYPLPEAQRDRFLARLSIGYPDHQCRDRRCWPTGTAPIRSSAAARHRCGDRFQTDRRGHHRSSGAAVAAVHRRDHRRHPHRSRGAARGVTASSAAPGQGGQGRGRAGRPALRRTGRHSAIGRPGARAPLAVDRRGARVAPVRRGGRAGVVEPDPGAARWLTRHRPRFPPGQGRVAEFRIAGSDHPRSLPAGRRHRGDGLRAGARRARPVADRDLRGRAAADRDRLRLCPPAAVVGVASGLAESAGPGDRRTRGAVDPERGVEPHRHAGDLRTERPST